MSNIVDQDILTFVKKQYLDYGMEVIQHRALPDFRDGLKPVHRRILWDMFQQGMHFSGGLVKSARVAGSVMGLYHPHSGDAIYDAMVTLANMPQPLLYGNGNWGTAFDNAAAQRYTEVKLSKYSDLYMVSPDYLAVTPLHDNYDGSRKEPLYLPSLLPNLLFNGVSGIAVGVTTDIPPFHPEGVLKLVSLALEDKKIGPKACVKHLRTNFKYGSHTVSTDDERLAYFVNGKGSFAQGVDYKINVRERQMVITGITPNFTMKSLINKMEKFKDVASVGDFSEDGVLRVVIQFTTAVSANGIEERCQDIYKKLVSRSSYTTNITVRLDQETAAFKAVTIPKLLEMWIEYRVDLEQRCQKYRMDQLRTSIDRQNLLILAANNAMFITKTVRNNDHPKPILCDKLDISEEDATYILGFTFSQISKLNEEQIKKKVESLTEQYKTAKRHFKHPEAKVLSDIEAVKL